MKTHTDREKGFILPVVIILLAILGLSIILSLHSRDADYNLLQARRLLATRDNMALEIRNYASMASSLRNSVSLNSSLFSCVGGATCSAGGPFPLTLAGPTLNGSLQPVIVAGPPPDGALYDVWGVACSTTNCPISVTSQFSIVCPTGQSSCVSNSAGIQVSYSVQKTPNSVYPGVLAPRSSPIPVLVPVACITASAASGPPAVPCY